MPTSNERKMLSSNEALKELICLFSIYQSNNRLHEYMSLLGILLLVRLILLPKIGKTILTQFVVPQRSQLFLNAWLYFVLLCGQGT